MRPRLLLGLVLATIVGAAPPGSTRPDAPRRVIIRLADPSPRGHLIAQALEGTRTMDERHESVVRGLRSLHVSALERARPALETAQREGGLREIDRLWIVNAVVAEVDTGWIERLESDPAVRSVLPDRLLTAGAVPGGLAPSEAFTSGVPTNDLVRIRVPEVWDQGITGHGAIVANVDSGVHGDDDTLNDSWRGRLVGADAAWFAPTALTVFPVDDDLGSTGGHGTATMGIMAGGDRDFGVAPDAVWIAGDVFQGDEGYVSTAIKIFEWLADPDGDPSTRSDVPDVVNNSYGLTFPDSPEIPCDPIFDDAIDAIEAAGVIMVWSAGNEGQRGITVPANRADSPVNAFAVGGVDAQDTPFGSGTRGSGIGPSACGGSFATKPEVVAPGVRVTSRTRFNQTSSGFTGTSFSTPMAAGVLALMRSKNPQISPEEAKSILLETARDLEQAGDDNRTGGGLVDAEAALARVERPGSPLARLMGYRPVDRAASKLDVTDIEDALVVRPGSSHELAPELVNHGPAIGPSTATLTSDAPGVTVTRGTISLEAAGTGEPFGPAGGETFAVAVDENVAPGSDIPLTLSIQGAQIGPFRLVLKAGDPVPGVFATHDEGRVRLSVTNFGGIGYYTGRHQPVFVLRGDGFRFPASSENWLFHAGLMVATGPPRVSDGVPYSEDTQNATDWIPLAGAPLDVGRSAGGQRIVARYDDRRALSPLDLEVLAESFAFGDPGEDAFVLLQWVLTNRGDATLSGIRAGIFADFDLPDDQGEPTETAGWDPSRRLGFVEGRQPGQPALGVVGLDDVSLNQITYAVLSRDSIAQSRRGSPANSRAATPAEAPVGFEEFTDQEKWEALTSGQTRTSDARGRDLWQILAVGPLTISAGGSDTVAVALVAGETLETLQAHAETARESYFVRVLGIDPPSPPQPPGALTLEQNFPNPFRFGQQTTIRIAVPGSGSSAGPSRAELAVFDVTGRKVRSLIDGEISAGEQSVSWDGRDDQGTVLPRGVYVVRLVTSGGGERSIRVLFLR